jgi:hypothetical protein
VLLVWMVIANVNYQSDMESLQWVVLIIKEQHVAS